MQGGSALSSMLNFTKIVTVNTKINDHLPTTADQHFR